jgi:hypothetical protein
MIVITLTWTQLVVWALMSIATYCILQVAYSYSDHPRIAHWLNGSDDYRRWKDEA